jgi:hypothetical protein
MSAGGAIAFEAADLSIDVGHGLILAEGLPLSLGTNIETPQQKTRRIVQIRPELDYSTGLSQGFIVADRSPDPIQIAGALDFAPWLQGFYEIGKVFIETASVDPNWISTPPLRLNRITDELTRQARFEDQLRGMFIAEPIEDGFTHPAQALIERALEQNEPQASEWIQSFVRAEPPSFAAAALKCVGRLSAPGSEHWRMSLAEQSLKHEDSGVRDEAVQALESWGGKWSIEILKEHHEPRPWLRDYIQRVIRDLSQGR